jgi:class 3 adenylate cyclase
MRDEDYPIGYPRKTADKLMQQFEEFWGTGMILLNTAPSGARDPDFCQRFARSERLCLPPGAALSLQMQGIGLKLRIGLHTGELEYKQGIPRGIALHLTSRIMSVAEQNELCVSRTVRDLVIGSEIAFKDKGAYPLKGIPDQWQLFSVV